MYLNDASKMAEARKVLQRKARDNARTPVQWDSSPHAGFTSPSATPWMRVNDDYKNELSVHAFWKKALANRKEYKSVLIYGDFQLVDETHELIFAYKRSNTKNTWVVVLN
jgi:oligo-1,6-glucosidase